MDTLTENQMARILKGATLLDEKVGKNWAGRINVQSLDLDTFSACVLAQLYGSYWNGEEALFGPGECAYVIAAEYGFYPHGEDSTQDSNESYLLGKMKTEYWRGLILGRQQS